MCRDRFHSFLAVGLICFWPFVCIQKQCRVLFRLFWMHWTMFDLSNFSIFQFFRSFGLLDKYKSAAGKGRHRSCNQCDCRSTFIYSHPHSELDQPTFFTHVRHFLRHSFDSNEIKFSSLVCFFLFSINRIDFSLVFSNFCCFSQIFHLFASTCVVDLPPDLFVLFRNDFRLWADQWILFLISLAMCDTHTHCVFIDLWSFF